MIVFATDITPRLNYILDFISNEIAEKRFILTNSKNEYLSFEGPRINYSNEKISEGEFQIKPIGLLASTGINEQIIECFEFDGYKAFFKTEGNIPFDIFAATFYLLSRYEEYLPHKKDIYGRFAYENSLAFRENFLLVPLVNQWLQAFKNALQEYFPLFTKKMSSFSFQPTYDIDEAFSYKYKGWYRNAGGAVKDILNGNWNKVVVRRKVLNNKLKDTYDSYDWIDALHQHYGLKPNYFFLVPEHKGKYDKNILPSHKSLQQLIQKHALKYSVGIHPSWQSGDNHSLLNKEIKTLESITGRKITSSRQHFIRFTLPETFRLLIENGIKEDYSMGYGSINGFRASVASPFYWYDLEKEEQTELLIYPFCYMDANSYYEQKLTPNQALDEMLYYMNEVKKVNATLITIWHNTYLGTDSIYTGWKEAYETFIEKAIN